VRSPIDDQNLFIELHAETTVELIRLEKLLDLLSNLTDIKSTKLLLSLLKNMVATGTLFAVKNNARKMVVAQNSWPQKA
jgi:hypothetical protein